MPDLKRLERLVEMLSIIDKGEAAIAGSLAAHFGVAERTIYRDIGVLQIDSPIQFDEEKGSYRFPKGYSLKKADLSSDELRAMLVSKALLSKLGEGVSEACGRLMKKLNVELGRKTGQRLKTVTQNYWFDIDPVEDFSAVKKQFEAIQKALDEKTSLEIKYHTMRDEQERERRKWHPSQKIEKSKDGSIIFSVTLNGTKELRWWVYQ